MVYLDYYKMEVIRNICYRLNNLSTKWVDPPKSLDVKLKRQPKTRIRVMRSELHQYIRLFVDRQTIRQLISEVWPVNQSALRAGEYPHSGVERDRSLPGPTPHLFTCLLLNPNPFFPCPPPVQVSLVSCPRTPEPRSHGRYCNGERWWATVVGRNVRAVADTTSRTHDNAFPRKHDLVSFVRHIW